MSHIGHSGHSGHSGHGGHHATHGHHGHHHMGGHPDQLPNWNSAVQTNYSKYSEIFQSPLVPIAASFIIFLIMMLAVGGADLTMLMPKGPGTANMRENFRNSQPAAEAVYPAQQPNYQPATYQQQQQQYQYQYQPVQAQYQQMQVQPQYQPVQLQAPQAYGSAPNFGRPRVIADR